MNQEIELYVAANGKRRIMKVDTSITLKELKRQVSLDFLIDQSIEFRFKKLHSLSKKPYVFESVFLLHHNDEIEVELLTKSLKYDLIKEDLILDLDSEPLNSQILPTQPMLSNNPSQIPRRQSKRANKSSRVKYIS